MTRPFGRYAVGALGLLLTLSGGTITPAWAETVRDGLVLDHVTVVDVRTGKLARDRAVVINDGKISKIVAAGTVTVAATARRIDERGRFVVPGYNDMHAHNLNSDSPQTSLPLMLANGVTGFRQMAGSPELLAARKAGKPLLPADSPALLAMPGTILAGPAFAAPADAVAEVARQKAEGADFIKVIDVPPATFIAAADAARANGLPYAGHLPQAVDIREAMRHHMASDEHMGPGVTLLIACSRDEAAIRAMLASLPNGPRGGTDFAAAPEQVRKMLANPILLTPPQGFALMHRVLATYDEAKCQSLAKEVAASETWMVPTLSREEAMSLGNTTALRDNSDLRYVPASSRVLWQEVGGMFDARITPEQRQTLIDLFDGYLKLTTLFDAAGVKMLSGTDFGGQWLVPGFSLHHEFDLLARAGVSPLHILQMATLNPAIFLHREQTMGTVEAGKNADLVLLDSDPTASVANMHKVAGVVRAGRYLDRSDLDAIESREAAALK